MEGKENKHNNYLCIFYAPQTKSNRKSRCKNEIQCDKFTLLFLYNTLNNLLKILSWDTFFQVIKKQPVLM